MAAPAPDTASTPTPASAARERLDKVLVARGLSASRAKAVEAIAAGLVLVDGQVATDANQKVSTSQVIEADPPYPWVSRGGLKLDHGLDLFGLDPAGRVALDLGASTGGFAQVLRARGARLVHAVDVGRDQMHPSLRADPAIRVMEGLDARALPVLDPLPDLLVCDVSFIGLAKVLPHAISRCARPLDLLCLIKPQFEAGRARIGKNGQVAPEIAQQVAGEVLGELTALLQLEHVRLAPSPIRGGAGACEFLMYGQIKPLGEGPSG